jgi:NAD+ synthase (glutamine-hydrolysing)
VKIALAQINPTVGDFAGNAQKILDFAERAAEAKAELVMFPELSVCGYWPADLLEKKSFLEASEHSLNQLCAWTREPGRPAVLLGAPLPDTSTERSEGKGLRNCAVLLARGKRVLTQAKTLLPFYDVFDEQRYFDPAESQQMASIETGHQDQPLAITVCEDAWNDKGFWPRRRYAEDPVERLMEQWPDGATPRIILNISASPFWRGKREQRQAMLAALAKRHNAFVVMVNQVGGNDSLIFDGSSLVVSPDGRVLEQAKSFAEDLVIFDTGHVAEPATLPHDDTAAIWDALVLGTHDYVRKCGFSRVLIGLSGGIDSALVAAIAVDALGPENVTGVGMPSEYSSLGSRDDARALAERLGIQFELMPVAPGYATAMQTLAPLFNGTPFGLAEENLQSRLRGVLLMALSNKFGALVLTTGNKSEMSTGYCTLYGDMVGALAVIGDVWKTKVYALARYANREREVIPKSTLTKPPSAELRPDQKDTDSLPPYDVLDPILEAYVERYCSAAQIAAEQGIDEVLVRQVLLLVERSEYKRQQAAPVLKVTPKAFGMGRRFPIAVKTQV